MLDSEYPLVRVVFPASKRVLAVQLQAWFATRLPWQEEPKVITENPDLVVVTGRLNTDDLSNYWDDLDDRIENPTR